ncbi:MAG: glutamate ABC transporter substrate-binding protein, partial [Acidimicrobiales bacterium]
ATTVAPNPDCHGLDPTASDAPLDPMPAPGQMPAGSTMKKIADNGRLVVGNAGDVALFGFRNPTTGRLEGFDIDVLREIAKAIFGPGGEDKIEYRVMNFAQRLPSLEDRSVDLVAHTMTINCPRWNRIGFSSTYFDAGQRVLIRAGAPATTIDELNAASARLCVASGSTSEQSIAPYTSLEVTKVPDITDCLVVFQEGRVDAIVTDDTVLAGFAAQDPTARVSGERFSTEPYGVGANAADVDLIRFVNGVLARMRADGTWARLYTTWLSDAFDVTTAPAPPDPVYGRPVP